MEFALGIQFQYRFMPIFRLFAGGQAVLPERFHQKLIENAKLKQHKNFHKMRLFLAIFKPLYERGSEIQFECKVIGAPKFQFDYFQSRYGRRARQTY